MRLGIVPLLHDKHFVFPAKKSITNAASYSFFPVFVRCHTAPPYVIAPLNTLRHRIPHDFTAITPSVVTSALAIAPSYGDTIGIAYLGLSAITAFPWRTANEAMKLQFQFRINRKHEQLTTIQFLIFAKQ